MKYFDKLSKFDMIELPPVLDLVDEACDGNRPLVNPATGEDYNCSMQTCPPNSYCHLQYGKCCKEGR